MKLPTMRLNLALVLLAIIIVALFASVVYSVTVHGFGPHIETLWPGGMLVFAVAVFWYVRRRQRS